MARVTGSWERPIQGVSQQPDKDKVSGQCKLQLNRDPSPLTGLKPRVGTKHMFKILDSVSDSAFWYEYNRGDGESYIVVIEPNALPRVFDVYTGTEYTVNAGSYSEDYIKVSNPKDTFRLATIADYTFIVNTNITVATGSSYSAANPNTGIVYCQYATYGRTYKITKNGTTIASYTTPDGSTSTDINLVATDYVVAQLAAQLTSNGYTSYVISNVIYISGITTSDSLITSDGSDGDDLIAIQGSVTELASLPPYAPTGYVIKVAAAGLDDAAYWLKAVGTSGSKVTWTETTAPETLLDFDLTTMPHELISEGDSTFTLQYGEWVDRRVGDEDTNPFPSFVDMTIRGIGIIQNRLFFLSDEGWIAARTNSFFDFFKFTTQTDRDDDPIDLFTDSDEVNILEHYSILDGDLVLFANTGQYFVDCSQPLTNATASLRKMASYPITLDAQPASTGETIMMTFQAGAYAGIRELYSDEYTNTKKARPITDHVAEYIKGSPIRMVSSPDISTLFIQTDDNEQILYVYNWVWQGAEKAQSAFHQWDMGADILYFKYIYDELVFVMRRGEEVFVETMPIANDADDSGMEYPCSLDRRTDVTATYNSESGEWELSLPYTLDSDSLRFVCGSNCYSDDTGAEARFTTEDGINFVSEDELADTSTTTEVTIVAGITFTTSFVPANPSAKNYQGQVIGLDRLTIGKVTINYLTTGEFTVTVRDIRRKDKTWTYSFNGRYLSDWNNIVGFAQLMEGNYTFPVRLPSDRMEITITTNDHRPLTIRDMEWQGMFTQRGRRM